MMVQEFNNRELERKSQWHTDFPSHQNILTGFDTKVNLTNWTPDIHRSVNSAQETYLKDPISFFIINGNFQTNSQKSETISNLQFPVPQLRNAFLHYHYCNPRRYRLCLPQLWRFMSCPQRKGDFGFMTCDCSGCVYSDCGLGTTCYKFPQQEVFLLWLSSETLYWSLRCKGSVLDFVFYPESVCRYIG